jgi:outer membrane protein assembly factor BamB
MEEKMSRRFLLVVLALCVATFVVPPPLLLQGSAVADTTSAAASADFGILESDFVAETSALGLRQLGDVQVADVGAAPSGQRLQSIVIATGVPLLERTAPTFYWRRTFFRVLQNDGTNPTYALNDLRVRYVDGHVTLEIVDRFTADVDAMVGKDSGLAGLEIRRTAEFDSTGLEQLAAEAAGGGGGAEFTRPSALEKLDHENYTEKVTVTRPDGTQQTYAAGEFNLNAALQGHMGGGADFSINCVTQCFSDFGGGIGALTAVCLVGGLVVCVAACALTAGVACIPCISGAGTVCGVAIGAGSLAFCIATCSNPQFVPTATPRPRATPTRATPSPTRTTKPTLTPVPSGCAGDCDGKGGVSVRELVRSIDIALGVTSAGDCAAADRNRDGTIGIDDLVAAVADALNGCGLTPQPSELLVSSTDGNRVLRYDLQTGQRRGSLILTEQGFSQPRGVAVGLDGNIYVGFKTDGDGDAVVRFDGQTGDYLDTFVANNSGKLLKPEGLAFGPDGDLYVSSRNQGAVQLFSGANGAFIDTVASLVEPRGLVFGPDGDLYVSSGSSVRFYSFAPLADRGDFVVSGSGGLSTDTGSTGLTFGPDGDLYIASASTDSVLRYRKSTGEFVGQFVAPGSGGLDYPVGLAFAPDGDLYVASRNTNSVLRYDGSSGAFLDVFQTSDSSGLQGPTYLTVRRLAP